MSQAIDEAIFKNNRNKRKKERIEEASATDTTSLNLVYVVRLVIFYPIVLCVTNAS